MIRTVAIIATVLCALCAAQSVSGDIVYPPPAGATPFPYNYETRWWTAQVDNFNYAFSGRTFQLRYLYNEQYYKPGGPIFFYTGNEGDIGLFCNNTGFMWDIAPQFNALLVFAEHRYYGQSLPFGDKSFTNENYVHLSAEQALADYAQLLTSLKVNMSIPDAQIIAFGGSYGGMLTSWFRKKYPHIVAGGIAGSAPIWFFDTKYNGDFDAGAYTRICSNDYKEAAPNCFDNISKSWNAMLALGSTAAGLKQVSEILGLCSPLTDIANITNTVFPWVSNVYQSMPMGDYPYYATFLGPMPANPVNLTCTWWGGAAMSQTDLVQATRNTVNLFYNYSGQAGACHNIAAEQGIASLGDGTQWNYQSCTEMVMPIGQYGPPNDLFYVAPWNLTATIEQCQQQFGVTPQTYWVEAQWGVGASSWTDASNIVFSNGVLDPWAAGGVTSSIGDTLPAISVIGGAHHLDLRAYDKEDPAGVISARQQEVAWIQTFLSDPSPLAPQDCGNSGLTKAQVAFISVIATLVAGAVAILAYTRCSQKPAITLNAPSTEYSSI